MPDLSVAHFRRVLTLSALALAFGGQTVASHAQSSNTQRADVQFALVRYNGGHWNPRPHGLPRLAWEIRKRTSIAIGLDTAQVDPASDAVFNFPILVWQGDAAFEPLPQAAINNLRQHLTLGGSLWVDISDAQAGGPFDRSVRRELGRIFPDQPLARIPDGHVIYKSFYLLDRHGGRVPTHAYLEGLFVENRLAVVLCANDLAGAMARNEFGEWEYDVGAGGSTTREMSFRLGLNWVMYALCLDYKEDQVHIPFILQRRR